ncbi:hypothetical protein DIE14_23130 [Burkholderia sp. Bp9017]|uniref:hypothetical protein n=1 Tax=unclassified Burkholderia TaxID=2613784 RepID=UPI000F5DEB68|nr:MULTISPECIES: hypothetical protein [unclassified Burkholderia]RQZ24052.1 hypothetical protein DIE14_23130 [Burkholderia sp. Bp9017]RQZ31992.1 hypothetical protein DIE13_23000 [Burkholderia sp. Bp9016]
MLTENQVLKVRDHFVDEVIRSGGDDGVPADALRWVTGAARVTVDEREALARRYLSDNGLNSNPGESAVEALDRFSAMSDAELVAHLIACGKL